MPISDRTTGYDPNPLLCVLRCGSASKYRVFFLDYGGTLVKDTPSPGTARRFGQSPLIAVVLLRFYWARTSTIAAVPHQNASVVGVTDVAHVVVVRRGDERLRQAAV